MWKVHWARPLHSGWLVLYRGGGGGSEAKKQFVYLKLTSNFGPHARAPASRPPAHRGRTRALCPWPHPPRRHPPGRRAGVPTPQTGFHCAGDRRAKDNDKVQTNFRPKQTLGDRMDKSGQMVLCSGQCVRRCRLKKAGSTTPVGTSGRTCVRLLRRESSALWRGGWFAHPLGLGGEGG